MNALVPSDTPPPRERPPSSASGETSHQSLPAEFPLSEKLWHTVLQRLSLSPRQRSIVELALQNLTDETIAESLSIGMATVRTQWSRIHAAHGTNGRLGFVLEVLRVVGEIAESAPDR